MKTMLSQSAGEEAQVSAPRFLLSWQINILFFGLLIGSVFGIFYWQLEQLKSTFRQHAQERSRVVANLIEQNLKNSQSSREALDELVEDFLTSSARFIGYLDSIEPFTSAELTAFAEEAGLAGISIVRSGGKVVAGPVDWLPGRPVCSQPAGRLHYSRQRNLGYMVWFPPESSSINCVMVGLDATLITTLQERIGPDALLKFLPGLPGISYVRIEKKDTVDSGETHASGVRLLQREQEFMAETRRPLDEGVLVVGLNAKQLTRRIRSLRRHFFLFGFLLTLLGLFFSFLLYRYQQADLRRTRNFERLLAREHEAAALGRATAIIAHEVRNPLNAINMGLQRLHLEWDNLNAEQEELIGAMGEAVQRTSKIVTELQRFTRPLVPTKKKVRPDRLLERILSLYEEPFRRAKVRLITNINCTETVEIDDAMIAEVLENLVKNALEAASGVEDGFVAVTLEADREKLKVTICNNGFTLSPTESARLGEPYFTTGTRGTGLGLAVSRRLVEAHNGHLTIIPDHDKQQLTVTVELPR